MNNTLRKSAPVYLLLIALLFPSAIWIVIDHSVWPWDQAWYGEVSVDLWYFFSHVQARWVAAMLHQIDLKPPGIVWTGQLFVPLRFLFGSIENALLASILLTAFGILLFLYSIGRRLSPASRWVAAAGVVFAAGTQCFVGLSHQFFVEPLQGLAIAWIVWIAVRSRDWPPARTILQLACALLVGALAKASTPLYCVVYCLYIAAAGIRWPLRFDLRAEWAVRSSRWLMLGFAVMVPPSALWYFYNFKRVWEHVQLASSGDTALDYGFRAAVSVKMKFWLLLVNQAFLAPYLGWVFGAALLLALFFYLLRRTRTAPGGMALLTVSVVQMFAVLYIFSRSDAVEPRYLYALVVNMAVILMTLCSLIPSRAVLAVLVAVCGVQWVTVHAFSIGAKKELPPLFWWLSQPHPDASEYHEMERMIDRTTVAERYNITGIEIPWMNSNSAGFFAAKHRLDIGYRSYYTSLGYAEKDVAAGLQRIENFNAPYFITLDERFQPTPPNFLNLVAIPVLRKVKADPRFELAPFPGGKGILIFERHPAR